MAEEYAKTTKTKYYQNICGSALGVTLKIKRTIADKKISSKEVLEALNTKLVAMQEKTPDELYKDLGKVESDADAKRIVHAVVLKIESLLKQLDEIAKGGEESEDSLTKLADLTHRIYRGRWIVGEIEKAYDKSSGAKMSVFGNVLGAREG